MAKVIIPTEPTTGKMSLKDLVSGDAIFTLRSTATGCRFTYRVSKFEFKDKLGKPNGQFGWSVKVLTGPDNIRSYTYAGMMDPATGEMRQTQGSKIGPDAPSWKALAWYARWLAQDKDPHQFCELWLAGRCLRCGRPLTDPESIQQFYGPICIDLA